MKEILQYFDYYSNHSEKITPYLCIKLDCFILKLALFELEFKTNAINKESLPWQRIPNLSETIDLPFLLLTILSFTWCNVA